MTFTQVCFLSGVAIIVAAAAVGGVIVRQEIKVEAARCEAAGGVFFKPRHAYVCLRREAVIYSGEM